MCRLITIHSSDGVPASINVHYIVSITRAFHNETLHMIKTLDGGEIFCKETHEEIIHMISKVDETDEPKGLGVSETLAILATKYGSKEVSL